MVGIALVATFLSTADWVWDELFQPHWPGIERPKLIEWVRLLPWYGWLICGLLALVIVVMENAHKLIGDAENEVESLRNPEFTFFLNHEDTPQILNNGKTGIHRRISVRNNSDAPAANCKLVINKCSVDLFDFTPDSALPVKDNQGRSVDINPHSTEMFDLLITFLNFQTNLPDKSHLCTSTWPELPKDHQEYVTLNLSLTGKLFLPRLYIVSLRCSNGSAEITELREA